MKDVNELPTTASTVYYVSRYTTTSDVSLQSAVCDFLIRRHHRKILVIPENIPTVCNYSRSPTQKKSITLTLPNCLSPNSQREKYCLRDKGKAGVHHLSFLPRIVSTLCCSPSTSDENETQKSIRDDVSVSPSDTLCSGKKQNHYRLFDFPIIFHFFYTTVFFLLL